MMAKDAILVTLLIACTLPGQAAAGGFMTPAAMGMGAAYSAVARIRQAGGGRVTELDGVRVDIREGVWFHVRVSNTEPVLRIHCEAESADEANLMIERLQRRVRAAIHA